MIVKDIITLATKRMCIDLTDENTSTLLKCFNIVFDELAVDYFPLTDVVEIHTDRNKIFYEDLPKKPIRIQKVDIGEKSSWRLTPDCIILTDVDKGGCVHITYDYRPGERDLDDDIEYPDFMRDALMFGVCSEYCIMNGLYEDAYSFSKYQRWEIHHCNITYNAFKRRLEKSRLARFLCKGESE